MKSAEVALRDNNLRHAAYILGYASTSAQQILDLAPHDKEWGTKAYTASLEAAELFMKMGYTSRAANSYRQAADIALRLGDESDIWERRSQACWDKYLELK
jgi:hypothetical protein